jgi:hypothetical protein
MRLAPVCLKVTDMNAKYGFQHRSGTPGKFSLQKGLAK